MIGTRTTMTSNGMDIKRENGSSLLAEDGTQAAQHAAQRFYEYVNESVKEDPNEDYTRWYEVIFRADKSQAEKEFEMKRRILGTPGVLSILVFNWTQDVQRVDIECVVLTEWGEIDLGKEITLL